MRYAAQIILINRLDCAWKIIYFILLNVDCISNRCEIDTTPVLAIYIFFRKGFK